MASEKQVLTNRRNAIKSTGPKTNNGKQQSRRNAIRHGLTAATVVPAIEDSQEFECFAAAIRADYQPVSTIENELVARLTSLLWRLRRSALIETNLFQLQARLAMEQKLGERVGSDTASSGMEFLYRLLRSPDSFVPAQPASNTPDLANHEADVVNARESSSNYPNPLLRWLEGHFQDHRLVAAGHRVVHGGSLYTAPVRIDASARPHRRKLSST